MAQLASLTVKVAADAREFERGIARARASTNTFVKDASKLSNVNVGVATSFSRSGASVSRLALDFNKLRGPLTSVTQGVLQLAPGVASLTSVLGGLALGGGTMVAVLAGVAALGLAFRHLTKDSREAKEALKQAVDQAARIRDKQGGPIAGNADALAALRFRSDEINMKLRTTKGPKADLYRELAQVERDIKTLLADNAATMKDINSSASKRLETEYLTTAEMKKQAEWVRMINRSYGISSGAVGMSEPMSVGSGVIRSGGRVTVGHNLPREMTKPVGAFDQILSGAKGQFQSFKSQFSLAGIGAGLASGGLSMLSGMAMSALGKVGAGIVNFGKNLLGLGDDTEKAMRKIRASVVSNLHDMLISISGSDADKRLLNIRNAIGPEIQKLLQSGLLQAVRVLPGFNFVAADTNLSKAKTFDELVAMIKALQPFFKQTPEGLDAFNTLLAITVGLQQEVNDGLKEFSEALRNVPTGFKIAAARYNASEGLVVGGNVTVVANDPEEFYDKMKRQNFRRTGTPSGPVRV